MKITAYETMDDCVKALRAGEADALLHNSYRWSCMLQKPSYGDLVVQPSTVFSMDFRAGTADTPEGRARIGRLNRGIAALDDTRRQAVILDYTSRKLYQRDFGDYVHQYGAIAALIVLLIALIVLAAVQKVRSVHREHEEKIRQLGNFAFYNPEQWQQGKRIAEIINDLPSAIQAGEIQVWYQPQVDYGKGIITGAEALCRWTGSSWIFIS